MIFSIYYCEEGNKYKRDLKQKEAKHQKVYKHKKVHKHKKQHRSYPCCFQCHR